MTDSVADSVSAYLGYWQAAGVAAGVAEAGTDWFALQKRSATAAIAAPPAARAVNTVREPAPAKPAPRATAPAAPPPISPAALAHVAKASSLDELLALLSVFEGCGLKATAKNLCFYRGAPQARLMLIGEAPGRDEDLEGKPFVGRAGQLLDKMLAAIGIDEIKVHIANTVYWRPPGNRTPSPEETISCAPFLNRQIELVAPDVVVLLGGVAAKSVLGLTEGIIKLRGKWRGLAIGGREVKALATLHPAYLLRTPAAKRQAWQDLLLIEQALAG